MSTVDRKLKISMNPCLIDKNISGDKRLFTEGYQNVDADLGELAEAITSGWAYGPQLNGPRRTSNFACSDIAPVDIDHATSLTEILERELIRDHAALIHTTVSHSPEKPRARVIFVLSRTVDRADEMVAINRSLALRCGGDRAATDAGRGFFGCRGAQTFMPRRELPPDLMQDLIDQSVNSTRSCSSAPLSVMRSHLTFRPDTTVRLAGGGVQSVSNLEPGTRLHCPFHADKDPSAFTVQSKTGTIGIHCSAACTATFWPELTTRDFDFYDFEVAAKRVFEQQQRRSVETGEDGA